MQLAKLGLQFPQLLLVLGFGKGLVQGHVLELGHLHQGEDVLQQRHRQALVVQGGFNAHAQGFHYLQLCKFLRLGIDDVPGGAGGVGVVQVAVEGLQALVVVAVLPQVPVAHPPGRVLVPQQVFQTGFLFLFADVEKELQHQITVVSEGPLKVLDAFHPLGVGLVIQLAAQALLHDLVHPAGIQKGELAGLGNLFKKPVEERLAALLLGGAGGHGEHLEKTGVDVADDLADGAALAGGAPALNEHQHREFALLELHLLLLQLFLRRLQALLDLLPVRLFRAYPIFQH